MPEKTNNEVSVFSPRDNVRTPFTVDFGFVPSTSVTPAERNVRLDDGITGFIPIIGDVLQAGQAYIDFRDGNYPAAAFGAGTLLLPATVTKLGKAIGPALKSMVNPAVRGLLKMSKKVPGVGGYFAKYSPEAERALAHVDIDGVRKSVIDYQQRRDFDLLSPDHTSLANDLPGYLEASSIPVRPPTREEVLLNRLGLTDTKTGLMRVAGFNDGKDIVLFKEGASNGTLGHELRHSVQKEFDGHTRPVEIGSTSITSSFSVPKYDFVKLAREKLDESNSALRPISDLLERYNPDKKWYKSLAEVDAEVEKARQMFHPNTTWRELWDRQDERLDKSLDFIKNRFNLADNDEANFILWTLYENGYARGGSLRKPDHITELADQINKVGRVDFVKQWIADKKKSSNSYPTGGRFFIASESSGNVPGTLLRVPTMSEVAAPVIESSPVSPAIPTERVTPLVEESSVPYRQEGNPAAPILIPGMVQVDPFDMSKIQPSVPSLDPVADAARRIMEVENSKANLRGGWNALTQRWYPHRSHEGGADTIAYGIKLSNGSPEAALALKQGYLTDEQAVSAVDSLVRKHYDAAKKVYDKKYGEGEWDKLSDKSQSILVDYSYNPGLSKFPKLMEGFHSGNMDMIRDNYKRYSGGKELGRNKTLLKEIDTLGSDYPIFRGNGGKLYAMGGPGDWFKEKAVDLWYRKNIKPKIDELEIDEVRNRLYRHISPYSYVEADRRIKDALNDKEPEFENFQRRHKGNIFPADRDDIFATYLGIPLSNRRWAGLHPDGPYTNNSPYQVIDSKYRPSISSNDGVDYKALTIDNFDKRRLMTMATEGGEDLSDYSIKHGNTTPIFANYDKFRDIVRPPMHIGESRVSAALRKYFGPHTISVGVDPVRGQYVSYYDKWDLSPFSGNGNDETRGLGTPIEFYDRIYYDDYYGVDSRPQNPDEYYGGYIMPTTITANKEANGGKIRIKPSHRGRLTELKKRTGKSEAELYNDGNPAHKKMVVFARNSRKWKRADGGDLNIPDGVSDELILRTIRKIRSERIG